MKCPTCKFEWTRLDICPTLPIHDCGVCQGKNPPRRTPKEIILAYLVDHPGCTSTEIFADLSNAKEYGAKGSLCSKAITATLGDLKASGEIRVEEGKYSITITEV